MATQEPPPGSHDPGVEQRPRRGTSRQDHSTRGIRQEAAILLAERALITGKVAHDGTLAAVPDVIAAAVNFDLPDTWRVARDDGRMVWLFTLPEAVAL